MKLQALIPAAALAIAPYAGAEPVERRSNHETVQAMFKAFNAHDVDALKAVYAEDAVVYSPESCTPTRGRDAIGEGYAEMFAYIPDVHDRLDRIVAEGDYAAVMFTASSQAQGAEFELPISAFLTFEDGLVVEDRAYYDTDVVLDCEG